MRAMPVIDWAAHPEPWRTIGLAFRAELAAIVADIPPEPPPRRKPRGRPFVKAKVPQEGA
jgi:hypothetical protein